MRAYAPTAPALLPRPARPNNRDRNPEEAHQAASYAPVCGMLNKYFSRYRWSKSGQRLADSFFPREPASGRQHKNRPKGLPFAPRRKYEGGPNKRNAGKDLARLGQWAGKWQKIGMGVCI